MGDLIEFTSWPSHKNIFYKISSSGLIFEVKGQNNAAIGLLKNVGPTCDLWVVLGQSNHTWIKDKEGQGVTAQTPNIINNTEYRKFWLTWRSGCIQLGRYNNRSPIISYKYKMKLNFITFCSGSGNMENTIPVHWRFELPPIIEKPRLKPITGGELQWVEADNQLPDGSMIGGYENEILYIIRARHSGSLTPGKFVPSEGVGYIAWGGLSHEKMAFEVLCGFDCTWIPTCDNKIPVGAVEGGYSEDRKREKLYVGRALYNGHLVPGKVQPSHQVCYIPYDGREIAVEKYEILTSFFENQRCANKLLDIQLYVDLNAPNSESEAEDAEVENAEFELFD